MSGADDLVSRKDGGRHAAVSDAIRKTLQQKKQQGQHCDSASRTAILHDPANKLHELGSGTVSPLCHCGKGDTGRPKPRSPILYSALHVDDRKGRAIVIDRVVRDIVKAVATIEAMRLFVLPIDCQRQVALQAKCMASKAALMPMP